ncbi:MAG: hypothetical protein H6739_32380 [Alphaproteobacteria bacterium]|nr:hypothetical protein [Alphaproteobacteria bacterium]
MRSTITLRFSRLDSVTAPTGGVRGRNGYRRILSAERGERDGVFDFDEALLDDLAALARLQGDSEVVGRLGDRLRQFLDGMSWEADERTLQDAVQDGRPVTVDVVSSAEELCALPWGLLRDGPHGQPLAAHANVRVQLRSHDALWRAPKCPHRLLFAWSGRRQAVPVDDVRRQLDGAWAGAWEELPQAGVRQLSERLKQAWRDGRPFTHLHLLCHGVVEGGTTRLELEDAAVDGPELRDRIGAPLRALELIVLCACGAATRAEPTALVPSPAYALHLGSGGSPRGVLTSRSLMSPQGAATLTRALYTALRTSDLDAAVARARADLFDRHYREALPLTWLRAAEPEPTAPVVTIPVERPRVKEVFVGRAAELVRLAEALLGDPPRVCAVQGMGGVGKSYLAEQLGALHIDGFPGGVRKVVLNPRAPQTLQVHLAELARPFGLREEGTALHDALARRLRTPKALVQIDNADSDAAARLAAQLVAALPGVAVVVTGRLQDLGRRAGWTVLKLEPFSPDQGLEALIQGYEAPDDEDERSHFEELVKQLGFHPLAIQLAAGLLRSWDAEDLLDQLHHDRLGLEDDDPAAQVLHDPERVALRPSLGLSLDLFRAEARRDAETLLAGLCALGHAPPAGVGTSLGQALSGLEPGAWRKMVRAALKLSLLSRQKTDGERRVRVHPLIAELLRERSDGEAVARMGAWFRSRLAQEPAETLGERREELLEETEALTEWLATVPDEQAAEVLLQSRDFAVTCGPMPAWIALGERAAAQDLAPDLRSRVLDGVGALTYRNGALCDTLAWADRLIAHGRSRGSARDVALGQRLRATALRHRGEEDEALRLFRDEALPVFQAEGDPWQIAKTLQRVAHCLIFSTGKPAEARRILQEEVIPHFEALGDPRELALSRSVLASALDHLGERDEAFHLLDVQVLPVFKARRELRDVAETREGIADILVAKGELDLALHILEDEVLPTYQRVQDRFNVGTAWGRIAEIHYEIGDYSEALRIRREEVLPTFDKTGDVGERLAEQRKIATLLSLRGAGAQARRVLEEEILPHLSPTDHHRQAQVRAALADVCAEEGDHAQALALLREQVLPIYEALDEAESVASTCLNIARAQIAIGQPDEAITLLQERVLPIWSEGRDVLSASVAWGVLAEAHAAKGDRDEALRVRFAHELPLVRQQDDPRFVVYALISIALLQAEQGRPADALGTLQDQALSVLTRPEHATLRAGVYLRISQIEAERGAPDAALHALRHEALPHFEQAGDDENVAWALIRVAGLHIEQEQWEDAFGVLQDEVLERFTGPEHGAVRAGALERLSEAMIATDAPAEALRLLRAEVLPLYRDLKAADAVISTWRQIATLAVETDQIQEAIEIGQSEVLPLFGPLKDPDGAALAAHDLAELQIFAEHLEPALTTLQSQVLPALKGAANAGPRALVCNKISVLQHRLGRSDEALETLSGQALPAALEAGDESRQITSLRNLAAIHAAQGRPEQGLTLLRERALPLHARHDDPTSALETRRLMDDLLMGLERVEGAIRNLQEGLLPLLQGPEHLRERVDALHRLGLFLGLIGELKEGLDILTDEALPAAEALGDAAVHVNVLENVAQLQAVEGGRDEAVAMLCRVALPIAGGDAELVQSIWQKVKALLADGESRAGALQIVDEAILPRLRDLGAVDIVAAVSDDRAELLLGLHRDAEALEVWEHDVLPSLQGAEHAASRAAVLNKLSVSLHRLERADEALARLQDEALPAAAEAGDVDVQLHVLRNISALVGMQGATDDAIALLQDKAAPLVDDAGEASARETWRQLADQLLGAERSEEALEVLRDRLLPTLAGAEHLIERAAVLNQIGATLSALERHGEALPVLRDEALPAAIDAGAMPLGLDILQNLAVLWERLGDAAEALRLRRDQVLPLQVELGDPNGLLDTWRQLIEADPEGALSLGLERALPGARTFRDALLIAIVARDVAELLAAAERGEEAIPLLEQEVLPALEGPELAEVRVRTLDLLMRCHASSGDTQAAVAVLRDRLTPLIERYGGPVAVAQSWRNAAMLLAGQGDPGAAVSAVRDEEIPRRVAIGDPIEHARALALLAVILHRRDEPGDRDQALAACALALSLTDDPDMIEGLGNLQQALLNPSDD